MSRAARLAMVDRGAEALSLSRQSGLLDLSRSGLYYRPRGPSAADLALMALIDRQYLKTPFYGARRMAAQLCREGFLVGRKRVGRLMGLMGLEAIYQKPRTSLAGPDDPDRKVYPYLLKGLSIDWSDQVWASDITYIPMARGFLYLVAVMDWASRLVLSWRLSNSLEATFCVDALEVALACYGSPEIFNTDQGSQFTGLAFTGTLSQHGIAISMDGKGHYWDNPASHRPAGPRRAPMAVLEVRGGLSAGLRDCRRGADLDRPMDCLLQRRAPPPGPGISHTPGGLRGGKKKTCGFDGQRYRVDHNPTGPTTTAEELYR